MKHDNNKSVHLRHNLYSSSGPLAVFLDTLSYWNFYETCLAQMILEQYRRPGVTRQRPFRVVDVGCGTGELSAIVFEQLSNSIGPIEVVAFDPEERNIDCYRQKFDKSSETGVTVRAFVGQFEDAEIPWPADLIFCSHSLYQTLEGLEPRSKAADEGLRKLSSWLSEDGLMCLIMASAASWAYSFKGACYEQLGIPRSAFAVAEDLRDAVLEHCELRSETVVDTYADVSGFETGSGRKRAFQWLSYFLRVEVDQLAAEMQATLLRLVSTYGIPFLFLPRMLQEFYSRFHAICGPPTANSIILMHKETIYLCGRKNV